MLETGTPSASIYDQRSANDARPGGILSRRGIDADRRKLRRSA
jgi:hypothetical protein